MACAQLRNSTVSSGFNPHQVTMDKNYNYDNGWITEAYFDKKVHFSQHMEAMIPVLRTHKQITPTSDLGDTTLNCAIVDLVTRVPLTKQHYLHQNSICPTSRNFISKRPTFIPFGSPVSYSYKKLSSPVGWNSHVTPTTNNLFNEPTPFFLMKANHDLPFTTPDLTLKKKLKRCIDENCAETSPKKTRYFTETCVLFTYHDKETSCEVDDHFSKALSSTTLSQYNSSISSHSDATPMSQRKFPPSFWNAGTQRCNQTCFASKTVCTLSHSYLSNESPFALPASHVDTSFLANSCCPYSCHAQCSLSSNYPHIMATHNATVLPSPYNSFLFPGQPFAADEKPGNASTLTMTSDDLFTNGILECHRSSFKTEFAKNTFSAKPNNIILGNKKN